MERRKRRIAEEMGRTLAEDLVQVAGACSEASMHELEVDLAGVGGVRGTPRLVLRASATEKLVRMSVGLRVTIASC